MESGSRLAANLRSNPVYGIAEILLVFLVAFVVIKLFTPLAGDHLVKQQAVVWVANIAMLVLVWFGLKVRGQNWSDFGLRFGGINLRSAVRVIGLSLIAFLAGMLGFVIASILMANISGVPESSDMSNYTYLQNNPGMLVLTLIGVYIVSSFGEEVIYRAFLINRLEQLNFLGKYRTTIAVVLSSVVFGLAHYEWGIMGIVQTGFMGLGLGICYIRMKRNLWILVLAHAYMDTILMVQLYLA